MDIKKIRKSGITLLEIVLFTLMFVVVYFALFNWITMNTDNNTPNIDSNYTAIWHDINDSQGQIDTNVQSVKSGIKNVTESPLGFFSLGGIKGLLSLFLLMGNIFDSTTTMYEGGRNSISAFVPRWVDTALIIALGVLVIFLLIKLIAGDRSALAP